MQLPQQRFHSEPEMQITIFFFQGQTLANSLKDPFCPHNHQAPLTRTHRIY